MKFSGPRHVANRLGDLLLGDLIGLTFDVRRARELRAVARVAQAALKDAAEARVDPHLEAWRRACHSQAEARGVEHVLW